MHLLLILNTIIELTVPAGMLVRPALFYKELSPANTPLARLFACILAGVGSLSLILLIHPSGGLENGLIALTVFHFLIACGQGIAWRAGISQLPVVIAHTVLGFAFLAAAAGFIS